MVDHKYPSWNMPSAMPALAKVLTVATPAARRPGAALDTQLDALQPAGVTNVSSEALAPSM
ncbi:hypothetical protein [Microbispora sp. NPDC049633]|uniref:hypothetical protein n=1 Tax=Microbispora sp. NPDC049633 TaxID=3154355 RepID=UPI003422271A